MTTVPLCLTRRLSKNANKLTAANPLSYFNSVINTAQASLWGTWGQHFSQLPDFKVKKTQLHQT